MSDSDFEIKGTITEKDIPPVREYMASKYEPIITSCKTLEVGEGIEVEIRNKKGVTSQLQKLLKSRIRYRHFSVHGRKRENSYRIYIIRKS